MRVAVLQLAAEHGQPAASRRKAEQLLAPYSAADNINVLVLPEMAFTGYLFRVKPFNMSASACSSHLRG